MWTWQLRISTLAKCGAEPIPVLEVNTPNNEPWVFYQVKKSVTLMVVIIGCFLRFPVCLELLVLFTNIKFQITFCSVVFSQWGINHRLQGKAMTRSSVRCAPLTPIVLGDRGGCWTTGSAGFALRRSAATETALGSVYGHSPFVILLISIWWVVYKKRGQGVNCKWALRDLFLIHDWTPDIHEAFSHERGDLIIILCRKISINVSCFSLLSLWVTKDWSRHGIFLTNWRSRNCQAGKFHACAKQIGKQIGILFRRHWSIFISRIVLSSCLC